MASYSEVFSIFSTLVLLESHIASAVTIYPAMLDLMNASKGLFTRSVLLYPASDTESLYVVAKELPIPIKYVSTAWKNLKCEFVAYFPTCHSEHLVQHIPKKMTFIFFPYSWLEQSHAVKKAVREILFLKPRRQLILATDAHMQSLRVFPDRLCNVVTVSPADMNAPEDNYRLCASRKIVNPSALLTQERSSALFPKQHMYRALSRAHGTNVLVTSESLALLDAYKSLNNTIQDIGKGHWVEVVKKRADISLPPVSAHALNRFDVFAHAHYSPSPMCFFTAKRKVSAITFIDSWRSFFWLTMNLTVHSGMLATYMNIRCRLLYSGQRRQHNSRVWMFLVSTFLGKSPAPATVESPTFRGFASALWVLGMMVLGFYVQSSITAIRLTPMYARAVGSFQELFRSVANKSLSVCFNYDWHEFLLSPRVTEDFRWRTSILLFGLGDLATTVYNEHGLSECYRRTQAGTHVALSVCTDEEIAAASQWNLVPGQHLLTTIQAPAIHIMNPDGQEHRRLLLAILEGGLATPHRRRPLSLGSINVEDAAEAYELYFIVYIFGCAVGCLTLAIEVLLNSGFRNVLVKYSRR